MMLMQKASFVLCHDWLEGSYGFSLGDAGAVPVGGLLLPTNEGTLGGLVKGRCGSSLCCSWELCCL